MKASKKKKRSLLDLSSNIRLKIFDYVSCSKIFSQFKNNKLYVLYSQYLHEIKNSNSHHIDITTHLTEMSITSINILKQYNIQSLSVKIFKNIKIEKLKLLQQFIHSMKIVSFKLDISFSDLNEELVNQISSILRGMFNIKYLILEMSNSNINHIYLWTLFISLRNISLISLNINLHNNHFLDKFFQVFSLTLKKFINLTYLNINIDSCKVIHYNLSGISTALSRLIKLESLSLNFKSNTLNETYLIYLLEAINKLPSLTSLEINLYETQITNIEILAKYLSKLNSRLTSLNLNLSNNILSGEIEKLFLLTDFPEINTKKNIIGKKGAFDLSCGIVNLTNLTTLKLYLHNTNIGKEGIENIAKSINKLNCLTTLSLMLEMNYIEDEGLNYLSKALRNLKRLKNLELELSHNNISNIYTFSNELLHLVNITFLSIVFDQNYLGETNNLLFFSDALSNMKMLKKLFLSFSFNKITDFNHFSKTLIKLTNLDTLSLSFSHNPINKTSFKTFNSSLCKLLNLKYLSINFNKVNIHDDEFIEIIKSINKLINLKDIMIDVNKNTISDKGAKVLLNSFVNLNLNSVYLNLRDNRIKPKMIDSLIEKYGEKIDLINNL